VGGGGGGGGGIVGGVIINCGSAKAQSPFESRQCDDDISGPVRIRLDVLSPLAEEANEGHLRCCVVVVDVVA
jgi:hypothetical protein